MQSVISSNPSVMHGTPCFIGTRVPVEILFDYLAAGRTVDYFLEQFPTVTRSQVDSLLAEAKQEVLAHANENPVG